MSDRPANILNWKIPKGRRILVVSDIHGNLPYLKGLLRQLDFSDKDELVIDGDFLEKGEESLNTLQYIMQLSRRGNIHTICGNCDGWAGIFRPDRSPEMDEHTFDYVLSRKRGLLWDMMNASGVDPFELECLGDIKALLWRRFRPEWEFLAALPHAIETEKFVFAHAGMSDDKPLRQHQPHELYKVDFFLKSGRRFKKWVIVGHEPVVLYGENKVCANPIIDRESRIISIDGGCVLKDDGQLNALIIPDSESEDFSFAAYDPFPTAVALDDQRESLRSYYIRWGDSSVQVLKRGEEFSRCRHVRTGYEMDILTKYLFSGGEYCDCNDCTDYLLPVKAGDELRIVERTSNGVFAKLNGVSGWYRGKLK